MSAKYPPHNRPLIIKLTNRVGQWLKNIGLDLPKIDVHQLLNQAQKDTKLTDFGDDSFTPALECLVDSLNQEAQLSQIGRITAHNMLLEALKTRLKLWDYRQQHPEISKKPITRPLVVMGLPRTGTTIFYELLAQDPAHRTPMAWEVADPFPPANEKNFSNDPRISPQEKQAKAMEALAPGFEAIHENNPHLPQECVAILASHFLSDQYSTTFFLPRYRSWSLQQNLEQAYQWHYCFLQHLQANFSKERWLLKTPVHFPHIDSLLAVYPDAMLVQTHRDPLDVIGSVSSLVCTLRSAFSDHIDPIKFSQTELDYWQKVIQQGMAMRDKLSDEKERIFDVDFKDIIKQPVATIEKLYQHFDLPFNENLRKKMQNYIDNRPRDLHGKHTYQLSDFGLDTTMVNERFTDYCQRFNIQQKN